MTNTLTAPPFALSDASTAPAGSARVTVYEAAWLAAIRECDVDALVFLVNTMLPVGGLQVRFYDPSVETDE